MQVTQDQQQQIVQVQKIAPHLIQASEILQCSTQELLQTIERELMENPALESAEQTADSCSDCPFAPSLCNHCPRNAQAGLASTSPNHVEVPKTESEALTGKSDDLNWPMPTTTSPSSRPTRPLRRILRSLEPDGLRRQPARSVDVRPARDGS